LLLAGNTCTGGEKGFGKVDPQTPELMKAPALRLLGVAALLLASLSLLTSAAAADRPHLVYLMTDDQGYWDTGATGNPHIDTPHMDSLAEDGTQFDRFYAAPVCAPTRAGLMTGRYYLRTGLYNTRFGGDSLGIDETTVAQLLQKGGYRTGMFGKWHLGKYPGYQPQDRGFDEFFGHSHGHIERYSFPDQVVHNGKPVDARGYVSDLFTDAAMDFIETTVKTGDDPFCCFVTYNAPHTPLQLDTSHYEEEKGEKLVNKYLKRGLPLDQARLYGLIDRVDQNIGRLLEKLDELGLAEDTLVIFTSDNGGTSRFWNGGMNGRKSSTYEGGVRVPFFARWPGVVPAGGMVKGQASHVDILPTFCELAGVEVPEDIFLDGKSLVPLLKAGKGDTHHEYVYHTWDRYFPNPDQRWSVSDQRWKLVGLFGRDAEPDPSKWRLFDLEADPGESKNLLKQHPEIAARLREEFVRWFESATDGVTYKPIAIPVGHPDEDSTELQPSWATWEGETINYTFDGYDWDTIDGWKQPGEKAIWRLDVLRPGKYEVDLNYGCRPLDAGGTLKIAAGDSGFEHKVQATTTAEQFEGFEGGMIELPKGEIQLTAELMNAPGEELMRLRAIHLRPVE